jgi:enediyne biosynthesis protein E11
MSPHPDVYEDLIAEGEALDEFVSGLGLWQWLLPTPAPGWTIAHQIGHLASTAVFARASATDADLFHALTEGATENWDAVLDKVLQPYLAELPAGLLTRWRAERAAASEALMALPPGQLIPWVARLLPAGMIASAGIMELFAHGQDIADTLGVRLNRTDRIKHLVTFAVHNRDFGFLAHGLTPPAEPFRFELTAPSGAVWTYGPENAGQRITGPAVDFCLLATRRRHRADLALTAYGAQADRWLDIAQAYRGGPGQGRTPGQFAANGPRQARIAVPARQAA